MRGRKILLMDEYRHSSAQARLYAVTQVVMDVFAAFPIRVFEDCIKAAHEAIESDMSLIEAMEAAEAVALKSTVAPRLDDDNQNRYEDYRRRREILMTSRLSSAASVLWLEYGHDQNRFHAAMCRARDRFSFGESVMDFLLKEFP